VTSRAGEQILGAAGGLAPITQEALTGVRGSTGQFAPEGIGAFMSPFEDAAVQQALSDIRRQGDIAGQGIRSQAVGAGALVVHVKPLPSKNWVGMCLSNKGVQRRKCVLLGLSLPHNGHNRRSNNSKGVRNRLRS
jgi:hypothetical protein